MRGRGGGLARLYAGLAVIGVVGLFVMAWLPVEVALSRFVIEDMFYYLQAARTLAEGGPASLDGVHVTNGFHPLWMAILVVVHRLAPGRPDLVFHLALTLAAVCTAASLLGLVWWTRSRLGALAAAALAALAFLGYRLVSIPMGGLETGLAGLGMTAVALVSATGAGWRSDRRAAAFGVLLGLTALARMDLLLAVACLLGLRLVWPGAGGAGSGRRSVLVAGAVFTVCLVPWAVFSMRTVGAWLPLSGEALRALRLDPWTTVSGFGNQVKLALYLLAPAANDLANIVGVSPFLRPEGRLGLLAVALWLGVGGGLLALAVRARDDDAVRNLAWVPLFALGHTAYYLRHGDVTIRYAYPVVLAVAVFAVAVIAASRDLLPRARALRWAPIGLLAVSLAAGQAAFREGLGESPYHPMHPALLRTARWLAAASPRDAVVGSFNGGILSYYSQRPVVNLDGVMNASVMPAIRDRRLYEYLRSEGVTHVADFEDQVTRLMDAFSGEPGWSDSFQEVHREPVEADRWADRVVVVYRIRSEG